jgi:MerR family copper efflux transcriptional regulator
MTIRKQQPSKPEMAEARNQGLLNIGEASTASGVSAKSIRHYESVELIPPANRTYSNYRLYTQKDIQTLRFIKHARGLGFSIEQIKALLSLWQDRNRSSADVKRVALGHIRELNQKIGELESMRNTLQALAQHCHGDARPECPILEGLRAPSS